MNKALIPIVVVVLLALGAWLLVPALLQKTDSRVTKFLEDADSLILGMQQYKEFVGTYPSGGLVEISKALTGQSDKKVLILVARKNELNTKGEIVDPWGTAIQVYFSNNAILIRSAGPNKVFEDSKNTRSDDLFRSS